MRTRYLLKGTALLFGILGAAQMAFASDLVHKTHMNGPKGDTGIGCTSCHAMHGGGDSGPYLLDFNNCIPCHSPDGAFDGIHGTDIGVAEPSNWPINNGDKSGIYDDNGLLKPGKENWCLGCHDDGHSVVRDVSAANVAGKTITGDWQSPVAVVAGAFQGAENLIDNDVETGNPSGGWNEVVFDLGSSKEITHIKLYMSFGPSGSSSTWEVYGSNDQTNWSRVLYGRTTRPYGSVWEIKPSTGWNEYRMDNFGPNRYIKLVKKGPATLVVNGLREVQFKQDISYGYLVNGHKFSCDYCHDTSSMHIDGIARTYKADLNNYDQGYRLADIVVDSENVPAMEIPRTNCNNAEHPRTDNDFALCFSCHDKEKLLGDAYGTSGFFQQPLQTYFRNDAKVDANGNVVNRHLQHLQGRGNCGNAKDWDSDWDGTPDSPISCTACHNVHGSPNPAMTRHGELVSTPGTTDKTPMFNFQYKNAAGKVDPNLHDVLLSSGGETQFYLPGGGTVAKNNTCGMCHGDQVNYTRTP